MKKGRIPPRPWNLSQPLSSGVSALADDSTVVQIYPPSSRQARTTVDPAFMHSLAQHDLNAMQPSPFLHGEINQGMQPGNHLQLQQHHQEQDEQPPLSLPYQLVATAAFCKELELQAHLIHLNYTGPDFIPIHNFLKSQYQLHQEEFDTLAEFVRTQGSFFPFTGTELRSALSCFQEAHTADPNAMVGIYAANLGTLADMARTIDQLAAAEHAIDVVDYAATLVHDANKAVWFLSASRPNPPQQAPIPSSEQLF